MIVEADAGVYTGSARIIEIHTNQNICFIGFAFNGSYTSWARDVSGYAFPGIFVFGIDKDSADAYIGGQIEIGLTIADNVTVFSVDAVVAQKWGEQAG